VSERHRIASDPADDELRALLRDWDPIGVFQDVNPRHHAPPHEYDCMIPGIHERLRNGASEADLFTFLQDERTNHFGLPASPKVDMEFAEDVHAWWWAGRDPHPSRLSAEDDAH
jgi:hypothetical protein